MRFLIITILLIGCLQTAQAQDFVLKNLEACAEIVTYGTVPASYQNIPDCKNARFFSGGVVRYNISRFALRVGFNYITNSTSGSGNSGGYLYSYNVSGQAVNKEMKVRAGGQYNLFKKHQWVYIFTDIFYDHLYADGTTTDNSTYSSDYTLQLNGLGTDMGFGLKLKVLPHIYINPELYFSSKSNIIHIQDGSYTTINDYGIIDVSVSAKASLCIQL